MAVSANERYPQILDNPASGSLPHSQASEIDALRQRCLKLTDENERLRRATAYLDRQLMSFERERAAAEIHLERGLSQRIKRKLIRLGKGRYKSFREHRAEILKRAQPTMHHESWGHAPPGPRTFLMISHDQTVDRRIMQQATLLLRRGWKGVIVCLSFDKQDRLEVVDGVFVHRVGSDHIVPDCPIFWAYQDSLRIIEWWGRARRFLSHRRYLRFWDEMRRTYVNTNVNYPLPFDEAFSAAGVHYPAAVVVAHDLPALGAGRRLSRTWSVPLVYDAHELYYEQQPFSESQKSLMRSIETELIMACDEVFTVNRSIADEMARRYGCRIPHVLTNAVDPPPDFDVLAPHALLRKHFKLDAEDILVLFQGGLGPNRNLEKLVESWKHVRTARARLIFMGDGALLADLRRAAADLDGRVLFREAVPQHDLLAWTAGADLGIIPYPPIDLNTLWCTPNKLFEFIQAGVPMVANDSPELRRFVQDTGFGRVGPMETPEQIAFLVDSVLADPSPRHGMREKLIADRARYSWTAESTEYLRVMEGLPLLAPVI